MSAAFGQALELHRQNRPAEAEAIYRAVLKADPDHTAAWELLGVLLHQSGRLEEAEKAYAKAAEQGADDDLMFRRGNVLVRLGRWEEGLTVFDALLARAPNHAQAHNNRGLALRQLGQTEKALVSYLEALRIEPDYPDALYNLGNAYLALSRWREAERAYRQVLVLRTDDEEALAALGEVLKQQDDWAATERIFARLAELRPENPEYLHKLAVCQERQGRYDEAVRTYESVLAQRPGAPEALNNLGVLFKRLQQPANAERCFRKVLALSPDNTDVCYNLAVVRKDQEDYEEAFALLRRVLALNPDHPRAAYSLGILLYGLDRYEEAGSVFSEWFRRAPDNPTARHLAAAAGGSEMPERAADDYIREEFDNFAETFDEKLRFLDYRAPECVAAAARQYFGPRLGRVLDAGCGTGLCGGLLRSAADELFGVDLSGRMLQHARQRGCYDDLEEAELTRWLEDHPDRYDLIVSADTLVYFGGLERVLRAAYWALAPAGGLVFTLEQSAEASGFRINPSGRYAHGGDYVQTALVADGWRMLALERAELRTERGRPVAGWLVVAQKSG